ncbi:MAG: sugar phosphate isomerase/epimerase [Planctomycetes bacterium]|nr:sugar phosphate isomerase/epimerase [Planctomycetota bacterium]
MIPPPPLAPTIAALDLPPREAFDRLRDRGFRQVQVSALAPGLRPRDLGRSARRDLLATLRRREMVVSGLDAWIPAAHFIDAAHADRAVAVVLEIIDLAADFGACPVSLALPRDDDGALPAAAGPVREALAERSVATGVAVADHGRPVLVDDVIGVGVDPAAWLADGADPAAAIVAHGARLASARVVDLLTSGMRGPIGDPAAARLDVASYRAALSVAAYRGAVVLDARQWADPWAGLVQSATAWTS